MASGHSVPTTDSLVMGSRHRTRPHTAYDLETFQGFSLSESIPSHRRMIIGAASRHKHFARSLDVTIYLSLEPASEATGIDGHCAHFGKVLSKIVFVVLGLMLEKLVVRQVVENVSAPLIPSI